MNNEKLQEIIDHHEIRQVLARYCRGIDRLDQELVESVYHEGAMDNHGQFRGDGASFAVHVMEALRTRTAATTHALGQSLIEVQGDRANSETYVLASHRREEGEALFLDVFAGRYVDRLERRQGRWAITDRVVVWDWSKTDPIVAPHYKKEDFINGVRSRDDLCYQAL